jgi:hypothetical protein
MSDEVRDVVIEGRMSSIDLATCAKYLISIGMMPRSNSDLLNLSVQMAAFATKLEAFKTVAEARQYLEEIGIRNLNRSGRGRLTANRAMQTETLIADGFSPDYGMKRTKKADISDEEFKQMLQRTIDQSSADEYGRVNEGSFKAKEDAKLNEIKEAMDAVARAKYIMFGKEDK